MAAMMYAKLPQYQYQKIGSVHYQTFDRQTLKFTNYSIIPKPTVSLPSEDEKKEEKEEVADPGPEKSTNEQITEENQPENAKNPSASDDQSKSNISLYDSRFYIAY